MNKYTRYTIAFLFAFCIVSCARNNAPEAFGNFEAKEWIVSSTGRGEILSFPIQEGDILRKEQVVAQIDTVELSLQKKHLENQITTLQLSLPDIAIQIDVLKQKKKATEKEYQRVSNLVHSGATNQKKLDQLRDELSIIEYQIKATSSSLKNETAKTLYQIEALRMQKEIIAHQMNKCIIKNPEDGVVQVKFTEKHEFTDIGKPLYKLINTNEMILHCWVPERMLTNLDYHKETKIEIDRPDGSIQSYTGNIMYIAEKPEFTPSQVQTRDNRSQLFYHIKISVTNDGKIKPGMLAEIFLQPK